MYSSAADYQAELGEPIDIYELREKVAVANLTKYCTQFPLESEMDALDPEVASLLITALHLQIRFEKDNDLLEDNGQISSAKIGDFSYSTNSTYGQNKGINVQYSNAALTLLRQTGICSNRVTVRKDCSYLDGFTGCCE